MARIRSVHPSWWTSEWLVSLSYVARLLYLGLLTEADDQGVVEDKPVQLKMRLFPADNLTLAEPLAEILESDLGRRFSAGGNSYIALRDFRRWQRPKKPNAVHPLPSDFRTYVAMDAVGSELTAGQDGDSSEGTTAERRPVPHQFPTNGEPSPQMEEEGEDGEESEKVSLAAGKPARARGLTKRGKAPIPDGYPDATAIAHAHQLIAEAGVALDASNHAGRFRAHALSTDRRLADWSPAWTGWIEIEISKAPRAASAAAEPAPKVTRWPGPEEVWNLAVARRGEDWAAGYVGRTVWRDGALYVASPTLAKGIRAEIGKELAERGYTLVEGRVAA